MALPSTSKIGAGTPNITVTGGIMVAPLGTALPTDAEAAPDPAFVPLGYVSEDGVAPQGERSVNAVKDWNADIIAQLQTEHSARFQFTLYSVFDADVLKFVFGAENVTVTAATATAGTRVHVKETGSVLPHVAFLIDVKHGGKKLRACIADGQLTEQTENPWVVGELLGHQVTLDAFRPADGVKVHRYYDDGVFAAP